MTRHSFSIAPLVLAVAVTLFTVQCALIQEEKGHPLIFLGSFTSAVPGKVRGAWIYQESLYFHSTNNASFASARTDCELNLGQNATLLIIETQEELSNVTNYLQSSDDTATTFWIGAGYDSSKETFTWENNIEVGPWAPWTPGHPNSRTPITKVVIYAVGSVQFQTQFQTYTNRYLCELKVGR